MNKWNRGEIWLMNLDPTLGSEISKTRPAVIISRTDYNKVAETISVIPVSTGRYLSSFHTALGQLRDGSHAVIPQIRVASKARFIKKVGQTTDSELQEMSDKLEFYLDLM